MMLDPLPNTLSELILVAVNDARKLDRNMYLPNALQYHRPWPNGACEICDAGAVMAGTLKIHRRVQLAPINFFGTIRYKLNALDDARGGQYVKALMELGFDLDAASVVSIGRIKESPYYDYDTWETFDKHLNHMEGVAQQLEALGY